MNTVRVVSKKKILRFVLIVLVIFIILTLISMLLFYKINLGKVSSNDEIIPFEVTENDNYTSLAKKLKKQNLIKNTLVYKIYIKLHSPKEKLSVGAYPLSQDMTVKDIVATLTEGPDKNLSHQRITFPEGLHMRKVVKLIADNTKYEEKDIYKTGADKTFLKSLINEYWFLTDKILDKNIYYPLEGYLYPDTYEFKNDDSIEDIFKTMLDNTDNKLKEYQSLFNKSKYNVHQVLTLASVIELEASTKEDRQGVSSVFQNRLSKNMGLESDVTTYYGLKKELTESIKGKVYDYTPYNTRNKTLNGKLPIGPICNPSIESIEAALNPKKTSYYYFVADTNKKVYFAKTYNEHLKIIQKLKEQGIWNA